MSVGGAGFWRSRGKSFSDAGRGIRLVLASQHNAKIHFTATILVVGAGILFEVTSLEWVILVFAMGLVWSAEAFNTALEFLADAVSPEPHPPDRAGEGHCSGSCTGGSPGGCHCGDSRVSTLLAGFLAVMQHEVDNHQRQ